MPTPDMAHRILRLLGGVCCLGPKIGRRVERMGSAAARARWGGPRPHGATHGVERGVLSGAADARRDHRVAWFPAPALPRRSLARALFEYGTVGSTLLLSLIHI
eukprot:1519362-Heterocapsa_arctica.AAC.1